MVASWPAATIPGLVPDLLPDLLPAQHLPASIA